MVVALMEVGKLCGSKKTYLLGGGRKRNECTGKKEAHCGDAKKEI